MMWLNLPVISIARLYHVMVPVFSTQCSVAEPELGIWAPCSKMIMMRISKPKAFFKEISGIEEVHPEAPGNSIDPLSVM